MNLPSSLDRPFTEDNNHNHNALVVIVAGLALFLVLGSLGVRIFGASKRAALLNDDYVLLAVVVCACAQIAATFVQVHFGWGHSGDLIPPDDFIVMEKAVYAGDMLYVAVLALSKICIIRFYQNLSMDRRLKSVYLVLALCTIWAALSIVLLGVRCQKHPWEDLDARCPGLLPRWRAITVLDILLEALVLAYPVTFVYSLQMPLSKKMAVLATLSSRTILIPLSATHVFLLEKQIDSLDPTLIGAYATTVAELHLGLSVVLLTISSLKIVVAVYEDDYGLAYTETTSKSPSRSSQGPTRSSWRSSRASKRPSVQVGSGLMELSWPSSSTREDDTDRHIVQSIDISVTRESMRQGSHSEGDLEGQTVT